MNFFYLKNYNKFLPNSLFCLIRDNNMNLVFMLAWKFLKDWYCRIVTK